MGIPGFNSWFLSNNKQAYIPLSQVQCSHLYLDMNSILHNCLRKAHSYDKFHALLHKRLDAILRSVNPTKSVMLAIDGPAPLAKLITQRERRKKSFNSEERKKGRPGGSKSSQAPRVVSSTALTPGTPFMHDICVSCLYYVCARLANRKWQHLEFEVSGPTVAGEGEVKILGRLARPRHPASVSPSDTHVIVGDDADLILMALVSMTPRLHILNAALSDNVLSPSTAVMSVDRLHNLWLSSGLAGSPAGTAAATPAGQEQALPQDVLLRLLGAKADLALLAIMSNGNDYLPPVKGSVKLEQLWASYVRIRKRPEFADRSIITMVPTPPGSSRSSLGGGRELSVTAELDTVMLSEVLGATIDGYNKHFAKVDRPHAVAAAAASGNGNGGSVGLSREAADAVPWLKGALWTMSMYFAGDCPDYRWAYAGGNATVTGLHDLAAAAAAGSSSSQHHKLTLGSFRLGGGSNAEDWRAAIAAAAARLGAAGGGRCDPMLPHVCSLALLPAGAQEHVPQAVQHLMCDASPIFDMYASCDACDAAAEEVYNAQRAYNDVLEQTKRLEAKLADAQQQQQPVPPELTEQQHSLAAAKADALAVLHAAQDKRRQHEAKGHPEGVDTFDLGRLEAAVASVPPTDYTGSQKALSQLSHSMLLRMERTGGQQQQQQQQYGFNPQYGQRFSGGQYGQQQQQNSRPAGALRPFRPPPPPVERFGPAFSRSYGGNSSSSSLVVQRSLLVEDAHACRLQEDRDLWRYSTYMVLGTPAAAAAEAATAAAGGGEAAGQAHKRKHDEQQGQAAAAAAATAAASNSAAAAALKAALGAGRPPPRLVPTHLIGAPASAPGQPQQQPQQQQQQELARSAAAAATAAEKAQALAAHMVATHQAAEAAAQAAASAAAVALASSSLVAPIQQQQQQEQARSRQHKSSSASSSAGATSSTPGGGEAPSASSKASKPPRRKKSPSPQPLNQRQQVQGTAAAAAAAAAGAKAAAAALQPAGESDAGRRKKKKSPAPPAPAAVAAAAPGNKPKPGFAGVAGGAFAVGPPPPPAPKTLPLPSGLLGRAASSSSLGSAGSMGGASTAAIDTALQQQQQQGPPAAAAPAELHQQNADYYSRQQQPSLPLPAAAPPAVPLPPSYPGAQSQPPHCYYNYYQQQQPQQPQLVRPVVASPGYPYSGAAGGAGGSSSSLLYGVPYNPMRPPPLPSVPGPGAAAGSGAGAVVGRPPYHPGML